MAKKHNTSRRNQTRFILPRVVLNFYSHRLKFVQLSEAMTLGDRLKSLRKELGLSQEALGAQGFVSTPGWIKIENGQRQASEKLIDTLTKWLVTGKYLRSTAANALKEELLILKYLGNRSTFVREMAKDRLRGLSGGTGALAEEPAFYNATSKRGRVVRSKK